MCYIESFEKEPNKPQCEIREHEWVGEGFRAVCRKCGWSFSGIMIPDRYDLEGNRRRGV